MPSAPVSRAVAEQAIEWLLALQAAPDDAGLRLRWQAWCQAKPEHQSAWDRIEATNRQLDMVPPDAAAAVLRPRRLPSRRSTLRTLAVLSLTGAGAWALHGGVQRWSADYASAVGERRTLRLPDGAEIALNTNSAIDIEEDSAERRIRLLRGEILVASGRDPRLLRVLCEAGSLLPLGTRFGVRLFDDGRARLGVREGTVRLRNLAGEGLDVPAGSQVEFDRAVIGHSSPLAALADSWREGVLTVSDMRLDDFLAELARYRRGLLGCDPDVAALRLSGTFPLDGGDSLLAILPRVLPVEVRRRTRYWVRVVRRDS